jgi:hypothetical protein
VLDRGIDGPGSIQKLVHGQGFDLALPCEQPGAKEEEKIRPAAIPACEEDKELKPEYGNGNRNQDRKYESLDPGYWRYPAVKLPASYEIPDLL